MFLCRDRSEADWFLTFDNGNGPFDVWVVEGVDESELQNNGAGYQYLPGLVTADRVTLVDRDLTSRRLEPTDDQGGAYRSSLTISLPDGTVFQGDEAKAWLALQTGRTAAGE